MFEQGVLSKVNCIFARKCQSCISLNYSRPQSKLACYFAIPFPTIRHNQGEKLLNWGTTVFTFFTNGASQTGNGCKLGF